ncbi:hypothetical protein [Paenibacillus kobensis]|uniref:hypothetical protein n=1 Tax=Paenibacillus kobensis TaxID=59841 RepID=UPI000FDCDAD4|nr:hypothetical protein [Paenibacillus kobensis]
MVADRRLRNKDKKLQQVKGTADGQLERERYGKLSEEVSRVLRNIVLTLLVLAILSQCLLRSDMIRQHLTYADKLEGMPLQRGSRALH